MKFFWAHRPGLTPDPLRRDLGIQTEKSGREWGPLLEWSSSWSGSLPESILTGFKHRGHLLHCDRNSKTFRLLLPWDVSRKTKERVFHKSISSPQWKQPCVNWCRPDFVGPPTVGKQNNSDNFKNSIIRISRLPNSFTTTQPTFDRKTDKFELFQDALQASLKFHNQLIEDNKFKYFPSLMSSDALQRIKNISSPTRENLEENISVFSRNYIKPQWKATAKHIF